MKNLSKNSFLFIIIIAVLSGCRKDPPITVITPSTNDTVTVDVGCQDFPPYPEIGFNFIKKGNQYTTPFFNPNNQDEFVYLKKKEGNIIPDLVIYNMVSESETILCNSLWIITPPQWGESGWITFTVLAGNRSIWKIRDDGTELTQLTFGIQDIYPHFSYSGDLICYDRGIQYTNAELDVNPDLYKEHKMMYINLDGITLDSIMVENINMMTIPIFHYQHWVIANFNGNKIYFIGGTGDNYGFYKLNVDTDVISPILVWNTSDPSKGSVQNMTFADNSIYYSRWRKSLFKLDVYSGVETIVKKGCDTRNYYNVSVSPLKDQLLVEKIIYTVLNDNEYDIEEQHEIWLMNIDGSNERKILGN